MIKSVFITPPREHEEEEEVAPSEGSLHSAFTYLKFIDFNHFKDRVSRQNGKIIIWKYFTDKYRNYIDFSHGTTFFLIP